MPVSGTLYHEVFQRLCPFMAAAGLGRPAVRRLALLITGLIAAQSCVLARIAAALCTLELTRARVPEHVERGVRRTLSDPRLTPAACYHAELAGLLDWPGLLQGSRRVVLAIDESSNADRYHLLRVSLPYWGGAVALAWAVWEQNVAQPAGHYEAQIDRVLDQVAGLLPLRPRWAVLRLYARRFWSEPGFHTDKTHGWEWESSQVQGVAHHARRLLAMAWASR